MRRKTGARERKDGSLLLWDKEMVLGSEREVCFRRGRGRAFHVVGPKSKKTRGISSGTERFVGRNPEAE